MRNRPAQLWCPEGQVRSRLFFLLVCVLCSGCDPVPYDFGADPPDTGSDPIHGLLCEDLEPSVSECVSADSDIAGCSGGAFPITGPVAETLGCTPSGLSLGVISLQPDETVGLVDIFAWTSSLQVPAPPFDEASSLALFEDVCGEDSFGSEKQCDYRPWLFKSDLPSTEMFLHVQSMSSQGVVVGYQLMPEGGWKPSPPGPENPLSCQAVPGGYVGDELVFPNPLDETPVQLNFSDVAPARSSLPWICGEAGTGHRQRVLLMRNPYDEEIRVSEIGILKGGSEDEWVPFKHGIFKCTSSNNVGAHQAAVSMGCDNSGAVGPRPVDTVFQIWDGTSETQYLLVLQVPPHVDESATLVMYTD